MRRALFLCVLTASVIVSSVVPASAAPAITLTLDQPRLTSPTTAVLTGKVTGRSQVTIESWRSWRWATVTTVNADASGSYEATVPAEANPVKYRARAWTKVTPYVEVVSGPVPEPDPEPEPEPEPDPEPGPDPDPGTPGVLTDDCGPRPVKTDGSYWSCTLAEDFNGTTLDRSVWTPQTIFKAGSATAWACYLDDPSVISVSDGALHLSVRKLDQPITCPGNKNQQTSYAAGMVSTYRQFSQQYGRFEARFKNTATDAPGLHEAFWLWPDDRYDTAVWPAAGEIDIAETYSRYPDLAIPFLHYTWYDNWGPVPGLNTAWNCVAHRGEFNTYTLEWSATRLEILVNGKTCLVNTSGDPAFNKRYIVAFTQALGTTGNEYDGRAPLPAEMTIDYLRVWQ